MEKPTVCNFLIACTLFSSSLLAQNTNPVVSASPEQTAALEPALSDVSDLNASGTTSEVAGVVPSHNPQSTSDGNGNGNGNGSGSGSGSGNGSAGGGLAKAPAAPAASTAYVFPSGGKMNRYWLRNTLGPKAWVGSAFTASWNTWVSNSPHEWHRDGTGWSKRLGSSLLDNGINTSTLVLLSRAMHQDPMYYRCDCSGAGPRMFHAFKLTFMSRTRSGSYTFSPARVISPFTGPLVTRSTIYPDRYGPGRVASGPYYLAGSLVWNLVREFIGKKPLW